MKKILNNVLAIICIGLLTLSSCKKDETRVVVPADATGGKVEASSTTLMPEKLTQDSDLVTFKFEKADFGFAAATTNTLQFAVKGTNFSAPKEVNLDPSLASITYTGIDFNTILLALDLPFDSASEIEVRLKSEVTSTKLAPVYSSILELSAKPYPLISWVYVPGNYQGWNPATADSLISPTGNGVYSGVVGFPPDANNNYEFKVTPAKNWTVSYGDEGDGKFSTGGGNFKAPGPGPYTIGINTNNNSYTITPYSWGIIGSATPTGWDSDTDMEYNFVSKTFSITIPLTAGEIKFRLNDDWAVNLGGSGGVLNQGGANIAVTAGTYNVIIDTFNNTYTLTKL
ncbi:SusE domain-containing protein [Mucilaginibacter hurinus]|nr:SusE domain-containing protein [Mucilaginibacter hurinus]